MPVRRPIYTQKKSTTVFIGEWAYECAKQLELQQVKKDFVATGKSLTEYEVRVVSESRVDVLIADYLRTSIQGVGQEPGTWPKKGTIRQWLLDKGIMGSTDKSLNSVAFLISRSIAMEGNQVFRGERDGIDVTEAIYSSLATVEDPAARAVAEESSARLIKFITS